MGSSEEVKSSDSTAESSPDSTAAQKETKSAKKRRRKNAQKLKLALQETDPEGGGTNTCGMSLVNLCE